MLGDDMIFNEEASEIEYPHEIAKYPHDIANRELSKLWEAHFKSENPDGKILRHLDVNKLESNCILFVGINPSFSAKGFKEMLKGSDWEKLDPVDFYGWQSESFDRGIAKQIEELARSDDGIGYFSKFKKIADHVSTCTEETMKWEHLDLFFERQTSQKDFKKKIFCPKGKLHKFYQDQLEIACSLIKSVEPKMIVVANALASEILRKSKNFPISKFDPMVGHHVTKIGENEIPIFFSSMLTGQRALDNNSYERLTWHICRSLMNSKCK